MNVNIRHRFGEILRTVRERRGITLKQVANRIGVSESLISQIERNKVSPSVDTLISIADVLEIDLEYLFKDYKRRKGATVLKPEDRVTRTFGGISYEQLTVMNDPNEEYAIEALIIKLEPGFERGDREYGHRGKELGVVLEGSGELEYGNTKYNIDKGDCITFDSDIPHTLKNCGETPLRAVWIVTPPKYSN